MSLRQTIAGHLIEAMKSKDKERLESLRFLMAQIKDAEIEKRAELTDEEAESILRKQAKQRNEAIAIYRRAGRDDLADKETAELKLIESYLPLTGEL